MNDTNVLIYLLRLHKRLRISVIATTDIIALGFSPMLKSGKVSSRIATTDFVGSEYYLDWLDKSLLLMK